MASYRLYVVLIALGALLWMIRRAAGRLAPRAALAPLLFLISRTPVLVVWGLGAAVMTFFLLRAAVAHGHDGVADLAKLTGIGLVSSLGFAALVLGPVWMLVRFGAPKPTLPLAAGEELLEEWSANHFLRGEARGGKLLLTNQRLGFVPHRFNVQLGTSSAPLHEVTALRFEGERFLLVDTAAGEEWLVLPSPRDVAGRIRPSLAPRAT